ncbi:MAG: hypothetical protein KY476_08850 [Planctomycetes bacterium]|nr:hypothetical protein [Planctomycetota bacterium]
MGISFKNVGGPRRLAIATIEVVDEFGTPVDGATVIGDWSGCIEGTDSAVTQTYVLSDGTVVSGRAIIEADKANSCWGKNGCTWTFTVTDISKEGMTYDAASNFALARYNADGSPDASFDGDGKVTTGFLGSARDFGFDLALQADGKIVVVGTTGGGDFALARYNADGSPDTSFDGDGKVTTDFGSLSDQAHGVAIQADGKIVVAGWSVQSGTGVDFALARYNADGSLDTSFSGDGKLTTDFGSSTDQALGVAIQVDGKIVIAGLSVQPGTSNDFALARYNVDGSLDTTFSGDGKLTTDFAGSFDRAFGVAIQADGKIVVAGSTGGDFALARYNADGSLDTNFDSDGKVTTDFASSVEQASGGVAIQADGKIVAAGISFQGGAVDFADFALARYNGDGSLDTGFSGDGKVTTDFAGAFDQATGVAIQADGKIVAAGVSFQSGSSGPHDFALARYNIDGSLDTRFSGDGKVTTDFGSFAAQASGVAIQPDGKIVVAGSSGQPGTGLDFALARYIGVARQDSIPPIIADVQALVAGGVLNHGQGNALLVKVQAAIQQLDNDNEAPAINQLQAFINQVNDFIGSGILTAAQGQPLIDAAQAVIDQLEGDPLLAGSGLGEGADSLTEHQLQAIVDQAIARWAAAGADAERLAAVRHMPFRIADIPGNRLGVAGASGTIWIDQDAAGHGWFIDPTAGEDSEFTTPGDQGELNRMDLLTTVAHELGHLLGLEHEHGGVMEATLAAGARRLPEGRSDQHAGSAALGGAIFLLPDDGFEAADDRTADDTAEPIVSVILPVLRTRTVRRHDWDADDANHDQEDLPVAVLPDEQAESDELFAGFETLLAEELMSR